MLHSKKIFLLTTCFFASAFCIAQQIKNVNITDQYRAVNWTIYDGLSEANSGCMLKDANGFLWIGTDNGLNRFDGSSFKYYFSDKRKSNSIADNSIIGLTEDSLRNIWIGTQGGLCRYDLSGDTFTNYLPFTNPVTQDHHIIPFWATKNELYCMDYGQFAITAYNIHSFAKKIVVKLTPADSLGLRIAKFQYAIFDEATNSIWMLQENKNSLLHIFIASGKREQFSWPVRKKNIVGNHHTDAEGMHYDRTRNCIWINTPQGLMKFTLSDKLFHHISALYQYEKLDNYDRFVGIDLDTKGRIWFATEPKGIIIYNPEDESVQFPFANDSALQIAVSNFNALIYCDRDGMIWTGNWLNTGGVYQLTPFSPAARHYVSNRKIENSLSSDGVVRFATADQNRMWIGTFFGGINIFDPYAGKFQVLSEKDLTGIKVNPGNPWILPLVIDTAAKKALIEAGGLFKMDLDTKKCVPIIFKDGTGQVISLPEYPDIFSLPFQKGCLSTLSYANKFGIFIIDRDSAAARELLSFPADSISPFMTVVDDRLLLINRFPQRLGNFTYEYIHNKLIRTPSPLDSIAWGEVMYNKTDATYWVTTDRQLIHYNKDYQIIRRYTIKDGLPPIDISALTVDNKGNIWFHTDRSIHQLNTVTGVFSELTEKDGFERHAFLNYPGSNKSDNGDIYFPTGYIGQGFDRISPDKFVSIPSSVYFQSLEINQKPFQLSTGINSLQQLSLRYFENKITIETGIIDYYSRGKSRIRYKLETQEKKENWQYAPDHYTIRYEGLSPGNYKLIVQASNAGNEFNGPEKILLINIAHPFWDEWWFRILAAICVIALLFGYIQYRSRSLKKQNIVLEAKVTHRTNELKHSLEDLKQTQSQLIQSEKMASLGELTAGIAHEIQNPLNFVNNFSEVNKELLVELRDEMEKGNYDDAKAIANDVIDNEEKINHHGKRADAIVKGMLQHSRSSSGKKEPTDINALADEYLRLSYHGLRAKDKLFNATIKTDFDKTIGEIKIIPQDIGRVILNLINNAFYAVNEKQKAESKVYEPMVLVSTKKINNNVEIKVSDNGNGIPEKIVDKIFQPFFTTKPTGQGTGLGLSLSYDIIKAHNGEIKIQTKDGESAEFIICLPI